MTSSEHLPPPVPGHYGSSSQHSLSVLERVRVAFLALAAKGAMGHHSESKGRNLSHVSPGPGTGKPGNRVNIATLGVWPNLSF